MIGDALNSATFAGTRKFATQSLTLQAQVWGEQKGQPVLLLHGGGQTKHSWRRTGERLGALGYHAVALDLRGHGESDRSSDGIYTLDRFVDDIKCVVNELGPNTALIGASLGGIAALLYAGQSARDKIKCLVLVDIATRTDDAGVARITEFLQSHQNGFATLEEAADVIAKYLVHRKRPAVADGLQKNLRLAKDGRYYWHWDPAFLKGSLVSEVKNEERLLEAARAIPEPILLVRGEQSDIVSAETSKHFLAEVPHAKYVELQKAGHTLAGDANDEFTDAIVSFLQSLS